MSNSVMSPQEIDKLQEKVNAYICKRFTHLDYCLCKSPLCSDPGDLTELFPSVYTGLLPSLYHPHHLLRNNIGAVLDLTQEQYSRRYDLFEYLQLDLKDEKQREIRAYFQRATRFISNAVQRGKSVLIASTSDSTLHYLFALARQFSLTRAPIKELMRHAELKTIAFRLDEHFVEQLALEEKDAHCFSSHL